MAAGVNGETLENSGEYSQVVTEPRLSTNRAEGKLIPSLSDSWNINSRSFFYSLSTSTKETQNTFQDFSSRSDYKKRQIESRRELLNKKKKIRKKNPARFRIPTDNLKAVLDTLGLIFINVRDNPEAGGRD